MVLYYCIKTNSFKKIIVDYNIIILILHIIMYLTDIERDYWL